MKHLLIVFIGGGLGTVARFLVGKFLPYSGKGFPWNTFCANLLGCLFIGFLIGYFHKNSNEKLRCQNSTLASTSPSVPRGATPAGTGATQTKITCGL